MIVPRANTMAAFSQTVYEHIVERARHQGFLCFAVKPQAQPNGFAAYFVSTLSSLGNDPRYLGCIQVVAERMDGRMGFRSYASDRCDRPEVLEGVIADQLASFCGHIGPDSYATLMGFLGRTPTMNSPLYGSVGLAGHDARFFSQIGDGVVSQLRRERLLFPLGLFLKACVDRRDLFSEEFARSGGASTVLHNLNARLEQIIPS